ncbi:MAG: DUF4258 domain-containing protein [Selenomonadaceae bacterium]|nr:DUF4258 domain-containing protein [Selenomonadaceae bacterium]
MIEIERLREYFTGDKIFVTEHAAERFHQRNIRIRDIRSAVNCGEIIEQYPNDYPYPSCLILGKSSEGKNLHVVLSDEGNSSRIITAYFPDADKWSEDLKTRR